MISTITINNRGNITLPASVRKAFGIAANDQMIVETTEEGILLRPAVVLPLETYTAERMAEFDAEEEKLDKVLQRKGIR